MDKKKFYSKKNVSFHNKIDDAWIIYNNKVYDITSFLKNNKHPPGNNPIIKNLGCDITYDINFHSKNAKKLLKKYKIGYLESYSEPTCCIL